MPLLGQNAKYGYPPLFWPPRAATLGTLHYMRVVCFPGLPSQSRWQLRHQSIPFDPSCSALTIRFVYFLFGLRCWRCHGLLLRPSCLVSCAPLFAPLGLFVLLFGSQHKVPNSPSVIAALAQPGEFRLSGTPRRLLCLDYTSLHIAVSNHKTFSYCRQTILAFATSTSTRPWAVTLKPFMCHTLPLVNQRRPPREPTSPLLSISS
ncbi:hypothetical protein B0T24DRAFT_140076 [Lasiosphaeria ovina]|uniref:Uncharacterized protein n=1 Tax=Lasiosphaeria ovina TaxID=92902 RepID=A0AAE0KM85_9PEZI|nr:hypothetical protein B0T24DRAFT_201361 [Lasiosphaeria ovina]KAK3378812.1 hypothetical protein B0T24DRAFT_140076 [Lasiosphaeria ovina]